MKVTVSDAVRITDITPQQIRNLMKCNIRIKVNARNALGESIDFVYLLERTEYKEIIVSKAKNAVKKETVNYGTAAKMVTEVINKAEAEHGIFEVTISKSEYLTKKKLFDLFSRLKKFVVDGLIYMDFNNPLLTCKFDDGSGFICSMYYWLDDKWLYAFGPNIPTFEKSGTVEIENILCD